MKNGMKNFSSNSAYRGMGQALFIFCLLTATFFLLALPAYAESYPVTSFADAADATVGDGVCASTLTGAPCTLRAAIQESNASTTTADSILLPAGTYSLTVTGVDEDFALTGDLDISGTVEISGSGAFSTAIIGGPGWNDRIFHILAGSKALIKGVTISGGNAGDQSGAGLLVNGDDIDFDLPSAQLELAECRVTNNRGTSAGGGIASSGILTVTKCTIDGNRTEGDSSARGGGVYINANGTLHMRNSTVSGNTAQDQAGGIDISNDAKPASTLNNVTIANNHLIESNSLTSTAQGAGLSVGNAVVTVTNSILAGNITGDGTGNDCHGGIEAAKFSLIQAMPLDCSIDISASNKISVSANLGPLGGNGGPTPTHALLAKSAAINAGNPATKDPATDPESCYVDDQRGEPRSDRCDMGAFELQKEAPPAKPKTYLPALRRPK